MRRPPGQSGASADQRTKENAPSRWRPRPTFRLTTAEATTTRRAINLGHSVLGASGTLWAGSSPVKNHSDEIPRNLRPTLQALIPAADSDHRRTRQAPDQRNAPGRWRLRPASRLTSAEAGADRRAINLGRSVLGASPMLGVLSGPVKAAKSELVANCDLFLSRRVELRTEPRALVEERMKKGPSPRGARPQVRRAGNAFVHLPDEPSASA